MAKPFVASEKAPDPEFAPDEELYRRVAVRDVEQGRVSPGAIRLPGCSVNRAKYSEPADVLSPAYPAENGIASIRVGALPGPLAWEPTKTTYELRVQHLPETDSYAHTEINVAPPKPSNGALKKLRQQLADRMTVLRQPT